MKQTQLAMLAIVALTVALSGCTKATGTTVLDASSSPSSTPTGPLVPQATVTAETGGIQGHVVNPEVLPIEGAIVELLGNNLTANTTAAGAFAFDDLQPGEYYVSAKHPNHVPNKVLVTVVAGEAAEAVVELIPIPPPQAVIDAGFTFNGQVALGACADPGDPVCHDIGYTKGVPAAYASKTDGTLVFLGPDWETILIEIEWQGTTTFASHLSVALNMLRVPDGDSQCLSAITMASAASDSPVTLRFERSQYDAAKASDPRLCEAHQQTKFAVSGWADGNPTLYVEQPFTLYATIGYVEPLPADYTRLAG